MDTNIPDPINLDAPKYAPVSPDERSPVIDFAIAVTRRYWELENAQLMSWSPETLRQIVKTSILPYLDRSDIYRDMLVELGAVAMKAAMDEQRKQENASND